MSAPKRRRTVARIPFCSSVAANFSIAVLSEAEKAVSLTGLTGIRLTCIGKASFWCFERSFLFKSSASSSAVSF